MPSTIVNWGIANAVSHFCLLNHPTFAPPVDSNGNSSMNINHQQFGQSVSTISTPRILQMSLTVKF